MWESGQCGLGVHPKVIDRTHMCKPDMVAHTLIVPMLARWGQQDQKFKVNFNCIARPTPAYPGFHPSCWLARLISLFTVGWMGGW